MSSTTSSNKITLCFKNKAKKILLRNDINKFEYSYFLTFSQFIH